MTDTLESTNRSAFAAVDNLVKDWCEEVSEDTSQFGDAYDYKLEPVEHESRSGFIAFTNGGWDGIVFASLGSAYSSGDTPKVIQPYLDSALKEAEEEFDREHGEGTVKAIYAWGDDPAQLPLIEGVRQPDHPLQEEWWEFQDEWLRSGDTYFYKVRALYFDSDNSRNESGEPEVFFAVGVNTDFEYGRDHIAWAGGQQTQWVWEKNVKVADITPELIETFKKEAMDALREA